MLGRYSRRKRTHHSTQLCDIFVGQCYMQKNGASLKQKQIIVIFNRMSKNRRDKTKEKL